ncbi:unnamed protein product [Linum trigynum]|uniref:Phorbol-ester/DAG-type domain-containing protein n=1 Tax=Linum trigynum TaxID=586398 RepID=A0AAV2FI98_9ROSI
MKGSSRRWNRLVAFNLAGFLKCPLIDTHDIHQTLKKSSSSQTNDHNNNNRITEESLALDVAYGVASTQLSLKIPIIINGPHTLTPWRPLAASSGARLVVVECHPPEDEVEQHHRHGDYDVVAEDDDSTSLVHVDAESFDRKKAEGIVSKIQLLLRQQQKHNPPIKTTPPRKAAAAKEKEEGKQRRRRRSDHLHEWVEKPLNDDVNGAFCIACDHEVHDDVPFSTPYYKCAECDFALHKRCAERPDDAVDLVARRCPPYLKAVRPQYDFPSKVQCVNCRRGHEEEEEPSAVDDCHDCLTKTNLDHNFLPTVLMNDHVHGHRLSLVIMPFGYDYKYLCGRCDALGYSVGYKCYDCDELPNFHVACALLSPPPVRIPVRPPRSVLSPRPRPLPRPRPVLTSPLLISPPPSPLPRPRPVLNSPLIVSPPPSPPRPIRPYNASPKEKPEKLLGSDGDDDELL